MISKKKQKNYKIKHEKISKLTKELEDLQHTHEEVKAWGEFKEREVDQRTRHLVNVKNKMRDS